jgi:CheY-like chemotaxis protein/DNA-binding XRE family transcriptional regulator
LTKKRGASRRKNDLQNRFGSVIRDCRHRLGISQEELGFRAGLHRTYITDIERGVRNISLKSVASLSKALEISTWCLFAGASTEDPNARSNAMALGEVLMVEDNPVDAELALRAFRRARFANPVRVARDGEEAVEYLFGTGGKSAGKCRRLPQLVLLDLHMPRISGLEVLRMMKSDPLTRAIPVIVLTVSRQDKNILECSRLGVENYIIKPMAFESLCKMAPELSLGWALWPKAEGNKPAVLT